MTRKVLGIIPARYGSTRLPGKPLISILGKTLLQRTFENAKRVSILDELWVATDDRRIYDHVEEFGGMPIMTSADCLNGTDRLSEVLRTRPEWLEADAIVNIQGDEPFIDPDAIAEAVKLLLNDPSARMATLVCPIVSEEDAYNSSIIKCVMDKNHNALYFSRALIPSNHTQSFNPDITYYRHIGLYIYRPDFLLDYLSIEPTVLQTEESLEQLKVLEHGFRIKVAITKKESMGVDVPEDLNKIKRWLCK